MVIMPFEITARILSYTIFYSDASPCQKDGFILQLFLFKDYKYMYLLLHI